MNLVSIIIPYFKKKDYILDAINSILNQTYQNFEIIIVYDDIDKSELSLIYKIQKVDKRIKVLINKKSEMPINNNKNLNIFLCLP